MTTILVTIIMIIMIEKPIGSRLLLSIELFLAMDILFLFLNSARAVYKYPLLNKNLLDSR